MTVGADEPSAAAGGAASNRRTNKQTNEQCRSYRSQSTLTGLLLWVVFSLLIPPAIPDVLMWKDNPACGPHKFVEVPDSELAFYWPGKCDRCHLTASTSTEAMACCKGENAAWDCISKSQSRSHNTSENVECGSWTGSPKGIFGWSGYHNTHFWIDQKNEIFGLFMSRTTPFSFEIQKHFRAVVYDHIK